MCCVLCCRLSIFRNCLLHRVIDLQQTFFLIKWIRICLLWFMYYDSCLVLLLYCAMETLIILICNLYNSIFICSQWLSTCLSIYLSVGRSFTLLLYMQCYLNIHLAAYLSVSQSSCLSVFLIIYLYINMFKSLHICLAAHLIDSTYIRTSTRACTQVRCSKEYTAR